MLVEREADIAAGMKGVCVSDVIITGTNCNYPRDFSGDRMFFK
jgi:hypothetical protein